MKPQHQYGTSLVIVRVCTTYEKQYEARAREKLFDRVEDTKGNEPFLTKHALQRQESKRLDHA
jgi:hypothetical protein